MDVFLEIISTCISCDICRVVCPENSILTTKNGYTIETFSCTMCGICQEVCPADCIKESTNAPSN